MKKTYWRAFIKSLEDGSIWETNWQMSKEEVSCGLENQVVKWEKMEFDEPRNSEPSIALAGGVWRSGPPPAGLYKAIIVNKRDSDFEALFKCDWSNGMWKNGLSVWGVGEVLWLDVSKEAREAVEKKDLIELLSDANKNMSLEIEKLQKQLATESELKIESEVQSEAYRGDRLILKKALTEIMVKCRAGGSGIWECKDFIAIAEKAIKEVGKDT